MTLINRVRRTAAVLAAAAFVAVASQASAQEIAESHLKAARATITAVRATEAYDVILPAAAPTSSARRRLPTPRFSVKPNSTL